MLADDGEPTVQSGGLAAGVQRPLAWLIAMIDFIADQLPLWRDCSDRPHVEAEAALTSQLCFHLTRVARKTAGWDVLQFRTEIPDEVRPGRSIDLAPASIDGPIWIGHRRYGSFDMLVPIECKRLPTPASKDRDEREYLHTSKGTTGAVQRFKAGHHGAAHQMAAIIGYVQTENIDTWFARVDTWVDALALTSVAGWSSGDRLKFDRHDLHSRLAVLTSEHQRPGGLPTIALRHVWIEFS